ncbi:MAG: sn-glycerol-3-phosphate ABC transporter ATP-binding protein UgpC [Thermomicrobiales bacterium]
MAEVIFDHVFKVFGEDIYAVNDLSLDIQDGEFLVLVGPSGCGKSTALRCLAGLEDITRGRIYIGERDVTYLDPKDRDIAMVFQSYALYPHMSVRDNLGFSLNLRGRSKDEIKQSVERAAGILGLEDLLDRKPRELSGGQRQRVALGRAIVREPQAFLMDEPLSNLDAKLRVQTRAEITSLQRRLGVTTIYVTHDQIEAMTMGDRIAVMNAGVLQQLDTPQNLYDKPQNQFVATFIGSPAMNIFPANIVQSNGHVNVKSGEDFSLHVPERAKEMLLKHKDQQINVGIRPEDIEIVDYAENASDGNIVRLPVKIVEPLGAEIMLHLDGPGEDPIVARVDPRVRLRPGDVAQVAVNIDHLHAFDPQTEETLL